LFISAQKVLSKLRIIYKLKGSVESLAEPWTNFFRIERSLLTRVFIKELAQSRNKVILKPCIHDTKHRSERSRTTKELTDHTWIIQSIFQCDWSILSLFKISEQFLLWTQSLILEEGGGHKRIPRREVWLIWCRIRGAKEGETASWGRE